MNKYLTIAVILISATLASCGSGNRKSESNDSSLAATEQETTAGNATAEVKDLTLDAFNKTVLDFNAEVPKFLGEHPCVIDFYATWCGPCKEMSPIVERLASRFAGKVDFYRVDVDKEQELAVDMFGISSVPTFVYIDKTGAINTTSGSTSEEEMVENVNKYCFD